MLFRVALAMFNLKSEDLSNSESLAVLCSRLQELPSEMVDAQVLISVSRYAAEIQDRPRQF